MRDFIKISQYAGMRNDLAQAGGGNTSVKQDDTVMLVKSSGIQLADVNENNGYTKVDYRQIVDFFEQHAGMQEEKLLHAVHIEGGRASIETFLHAITGKYTLHSHPLLVNILTARQNGMEALHTLFPKAVLVPYRKPGMALAKAYYEQFKRQQAQGADGDIIFLANHGLVVSGENADKVIAVTEQVLTKIAEFLDNEDLRAENEKYGRATKMYLTIREIASLSDRIVYVSENRYLSEAFAGRNLAAGKWEHAFCPDCVVYGNRKALCLPEQYTKEDFLAFIGKYGIPVLVCLEEQIYILAESVKKAQEIENVMSFAARVQYYNSGQEMNYLSDAQQEELLNWDAEKYRRMMR